MINKIVFAIAVAIGVIGLIKAYPRKSKDPERIDRDLITWVGTSLLLSLLAILLKHFSL